ncbi:MAG: WD40 repeat domain-containing protein [Deltaproteobacteria bacterium]|nr:WD40 repeat domain-containing protein [Deltaproteobacteria bacterium]
MIDLEGNSPTTAVLSSHASIPDAPWSPDGSWLVFTQWSDTVDAPVQLRAIRAEATSEDFPTAVDLGAPADLVFDEHSLWQPHGNALQLWAVTARQMVLHDLDSGTQAQWDVPSSFWSPDGRWLLSVVHDDTTQTWTTSVIDTTKPGVAPIVLFPGQSISGGTWSTDGRFLAVSVPEPRELVVLDMSSGSPQVTATRFPDLQPGSWLDSTWMLSDASSGPAFVNLDGTLIPIPEGASRVSPVPGRVAVTFRGNQGQKYLTPQGTSVPITRCNDVEEAWAPDGAHVVCWPDPKAAALYDIDAVTRTTLTLGPIGNFGRATSMQAFWSPDGARVVFSAAGSLAVADAVTGEIHEIVPPAPGEVLNVVWRPMR